MSPEFLKTDEKTKDQGIFLLMVFVGVFVINYLDQGNLEWSIADGLFSTFTFGLGAILIKLILNYSMCTLRENLIRNLQKPRLLNI